MSSNKFLSAFLQVSSVLSVVITGEAQVRFGRLYSLFNESRKRNNAIHKSSSRHNASEPMLVTGTKLRAVCLLCPAPDPQLEHVHVLT